MTIIYIALTIVILAFNLVSGAVFAQDLIDCNVSKNWSPAKQKAIFALCIPFGIPLHIADFIKANSIEIYWIIVGISEYMRRQETGYITNDVQNSE
jgi:hypothetical protein